MNCYKVTLTLDGATDFIYAYGSTVDDARRALIEMGTSPMAIQTIVEANVQDEWKRMIGEE